MIALVPYDPHWPKLFAVEKTSLYNVLGDVVVAIEHIGSTAIVGIDAKPIIDILIGVKNLSRVDTQHIHKIESLGYQYLQSYEQLMPNRRYFQKHPLKEHGYHIHLVNYYSAWWRRHLLFRDYLNNHHDQAKAYQLLKVKLASSINELYAGDDNENNFFRQYLLTYPQLAQQYQHMLTKYGHDFTITNRYALAKSVFIQSIGAKAYFDCKIHKPDVTTNRLNGYIPQLACFKVYQKMYQDLDFVRCYGVKLSDKRIDQILTRDTDNWDQYGFGPYVWFSHTKHEFVGEGGLNHTKVDDQEEIELTYSLAKKFWGYGIATEIGQLAIDYAFNTLKLDNIICYTMVTNHRSLRVIKKLGFKYEKDFIYDNYPHQSFRLEN